MDLCHLCDYRTLVNEARDRGDETWLEEDENGAVNVFVIPKGERPDIRPHRDGTLGPQRKVWYNEINPKCECEAGVKLRHPDSAWKPTDVPAAIEPPPYREATEPREPLSLL